VPFGSIKLWACGWKAEAPLPPEDGTRVIFYVDDVDAMYAHVLTQGFVPEAPPRDAAWGERYFHLSDPDGHLLSFARPPRLGGSANFESAIDPSALQKERGSA
jgi:catechol 2,3-dioxygenase-like lactoylglutathione lyase family enzyme